MFGLFKSKADKERERYFEELKELRRRSTDPKLSEPERYEAQAKLAELEAFHSKKIKLREDGVESLRDSRVDEDTKTINRKTS